MESYPIKLVVIIVVIVLIVLIVKRISNRKANKQTEETEYEPVVKAERVRKERLKKVNKERPRVEKTVTDNSFTIRPQFQMCGNCLYWQGNRERVKYSKEVKINDGEKARCSNKDAYHGAPIDKRSATAGACKYYERW